MKRDWDREATAMSVDLSAAAMWPRVKPFLRLWLIVACVWWAYLSWGYWSYKLPALDPKPAEPSGFSGPYISDLADLPPDYFSPEQVAYRARLDAYDERRELRERAFWFSLPISIPLALWGASAMLVFVGGWATNRRPKR